MSLHLRAPTLDEVIQVAKWREDCLQALRTPFRVSQHHQENYYRQINDMSHTMRVWSFADTSTPKSVFVAFGGLQDIQWENGLAEISLIVSPEHRSTGLGLEAADLILHEAFDSLGLRQAWGECYMCGPVEFWRKWTAEHDGFTTVLPRRKYWNGTYYDSLYFAVFKQ